MDSGHHKMRINVEEDRLSVLPDDLIHKILSSVCLIDAIKTSVLSSRWRFTWTSIPHLTLSSEDFSTTDKFSDFVNHVISRRNNQAQLSSIKLYLRGMDDQDVAQRIMNHAFSLNGQELKVTCLCGKVAALYDKTIVLSLSGSQTLKNLTLRCLSYDRIRLTSARGLLSLTTLHLDCITLYDGMFSNCPNLENLTLCWCDVMGSNILKICHPRIYNLTLENADIYTDAIDIVTPQLKNLTILNYFGRYQLYAPELDSLLLKGHCPSQFLTDGFGSLEKAQLYLHNLHGSHAPNIIGLLQKLHNVKVLSLSLEIIQLLNSSVELISHQASPFANLKSVKIDPKVVPNDFHLWKHKNMRVIISIEVKNYLLDGSPKAIMTEVL